MKNDATQMQRNVTSPITMVAVEYTFNVVFELMPEKRDTTQK